MCLRHGEISDGGDTILPRPVSIADLSPVEHAVCESLPLSKGSPFALRAATLKAGEAFAPQAKMLGDDGLAPSV